MIFKGKKNQQSFNNDKEPHVNTNAPDSSPETGEQQPSDNVNL